MPALGSYKTRDETRRDLEECFRKWGVDDWNTPSAPRGPYGTATVRFVLKGKEIRLPCEHFDTYDDNLRAIYLQLDTLRKADDRGMLAILQEFFLQLPAPGNMPARSSDGHDPWDVLHVGQEAPFEVANGAYRALARGANEARLKELNLALDWFRERDKVKP